MSDRPIIFNGQMVRAILEGRKTQTRRLLSTARTKNKPNIFDGSWADNYVMDPGNAEWRERYIPFTPGDRLWAREAHALTNKHAYRISVGVEQTLNPGDDYEACVYREGFDRSAGGIRWRPSIHMPKWASRITLHVTDVRVQRVQEIGSRDVVAEGLDPEQDMLRAISSTQSGLQQRQSYHRAHVEPFRTLWNSIHGPDAWGRNDWVVAVTFEPEFKNISEARNA